MRRRRRGQAPLRRAGRQPGRRPGADSPGARRIAAGCWWRSPSSARARDIDRLAQVLGAAVAAGEQRSASEAAVADERHDDRTSSRCSASARGRSSRRARPAAARSCCPELDVPERESARLLPERFRRREPPRLPEVVRARDRAPLRRPVAAQLRSRLRLLPARLVHDEAQPAPARARRGAARARAPAPAAGPRARAGRARADVEPERALAEIAGPAARLAAAVAPARTASSPGVLLTRAYHEDRGEQRHKVLTPDTSHGTNPATVTMAGYEVVKVATERARRRRPRRPAREGRRRRRLPDADEPEHARPVRREHRGDRADRARRRRDALLRRREPQRRDGHLAPGRHGLRHRPLQPAQVVHPAARRRRAGLGADRGVRSHRAVPAAPAGRRQTARSDGGASTSTTTAPQSIGRLRGFQGNYGCFVRSYAYICSLGADGLQDASETAVLNANYLLARLRAARRVPS